MIPFSIIDVSRLPHLAHCICAGRRPTTPGKGLDPAGAVNGSHGPVRRQLAGSNMVEPVMTRSSCDARRVCY
jgi:hypothetical protein